MGMTSGNPPVGAGYGFNQDDPAQYQLYNVRYILMPSGMPPPVPATLYASIGLVTWRPGGLRVPIDQAEVDRMWNALLEGGGAEIQCGWLRDPWGVPWQVVPEALPRLLGHEDHEVARRVFEAMQSMVKIDVAALERAAKG